MSEVGDANNNQSGDAIVSGSVVTECPEFSQKACYARGTDSAVYVSFLDADNKSTIKVTSNGGKLLAEEVLDEDRMKEDIKAQNNIAKPADEGTKGGARRKRRSNKRKPKKSAKKPKRSKKGKTRKQKK